MRDVLLDFCPKGERQDFTCEVDSEFYTLVSTRLIHSFLNDTKLFKEIDLTTECLMEAKPDVTQLRRLVELYVRRYGKHWNWTPELKNKFILCTICHIVRHVVLLSKLNIQQGVEVFFKYKGEIYELDQKTLLQERKEALDFFKEDEPKKQLSRERMAHYPLPNNEKIDEAKQIFELVAATIDYDKLTPGEIVDRRSIAKSLLETTKEENRTISPENIHGYENC